jgi:hypothetical protein
LSSSQCGQVPNVFLQDVLNSTTLISGPNWRSIAFFLFNLFWDLQTFSFVEVSKASQPLFFFFFFFLVMTQSIVAH